VVIVKQFEVGHFSVFSYVIGDQDAGEALLIDPADDTDRLLRFCEIHGLGVRYILNTHAHVDHTSGNAEMVLKTNARILVHEAESYALAHQQPERLAIFRATPSPPADIVLKDGDIIGVGDIELRVIHTPGHSPGSISIALDDMVFTGDTLFVGAVGRTDLPGGSWEMLATSIRNRLFTLSDDTVVLPGHNYGTIPTSTIRHEKLSNPYVAL